MGRGPEAAGGAEEDVAGGANRVGAEGEGEDGVENEARPPRSVLKRPWDVEVDLHGERRFITVQPGDSILEAVSY